MTPQQRHQFLTCLEYYVDTRIDLAMLKHDPGDFNLPRPFVIHRRAADAIAGLSDVLDTLRIEETEGR